jgi:amidase
MNYTEDIGKSVKGLRIGVLREGLESARLDKKLEELFKATVEILKNAEVTIEEVSVPEHQLGGTICTGIEVEGFYKTWAENYGSVTAERGVYLPNLQKKQAEWRKNPNLLPKTAKLTLMLGLYLWETFNGQFYGKSQNLARKVKDIFDKVFGTYDAIVMPTMVFTAPELPKKVCGFDEYFLRSSSNDVNNAIFNVTGHPALTLPIGEIEGLPIGMMIVSKYFGEKMIYRIANFVEEQVLKSQ